MKQWTSKEFIRLVKGNGYVYNRTKGSHQIFINQHNRHISIPRSLEAPIAKRLIKEYNLHD